MPLPPSTYTSGPVTPQQLNTDLYTFGNENFNATGILFHTHRPFLAESVISSGTAYSPLISQPVAGGGFVGYTMGDSTALFSPGADGAGTFAAFRFTNGVIGSGGTSTVAGGYWLSWNFPRLGNVTVPPGGVGAGLGTGNTMIFTGSFQYGATGQSNCPFYFDLIVPGGTTSPFWFPFFWWETASTPSIVGNNLDSSGATGRQGWLWAAINQNIGNTSTSIPAPTLSWGTVTSAALNTTIGSCLTFLNSPPVFRTTSVSGQVIASGANTTITFPAPSVDNYSGWSTALTHYTAQLPGLYLVSETLIWGTTSSVGIRESNLQVTGTSTVVHKGSSYQATPVGPGVSGVGLTASTALRVFALNSGDSVTGVGLQNSGVNVPLYTGFSSRLFGAYMSPFAATNATVISNLPVPNTQYRWQAGLLSGTALTAALNQHLGTDLQFLMNKPYFTGYQQTAQTNAFASSSGFHKITIDTIGTFPRFGSGDNWGGWSTANTWYTSQLAGWYLVVADLFASPPTGTTGVLAAGIGITSSGSIVPASTPDTYQQVAFPNTGTRQPGVSAIGIYYLLPGESVYPMMSALTWGGSWGTVVNNSTAQTTFAQFSCFWVAA